MDTRELESLATALADKLKTPDNAPVEEKFEMISFKVIEGRMSVVVKAPSGLYFLGKVVGWQEIPSLAGHL